MEYCSARERFSLDDHGQLEGYASVFGSVVETWIPTVFEPGAWAKTLKEDFSRVRILWAHDVADPIGIPLEMREDRKGLFVKGQLSVTAKIADYRQLLRDGVVDSLSVGWDPILYSFEEGVNVPGGVLRHITEARLWEWSCVTFAADAQAIISNVSSRQVPRPRYSLADMERLVAGWDRRLPEPPRPARGVESSIVVGTVLTDSQRAGRAIYAMTQALEDDRRRSALRRRHQAEASWAQMMRERGY
ncbi:MAG: HK97 family phage prohead protease [Candidatus Entotheonellia bacterium]